MISLWIDNQAWRRAVVLRDKIIRIGSHADNDVQLLGVPSFCAQIIDTERADGLVELPLSFKLVNVGSVPITVRSAHDTPTQTDMTMTLKQTDVQTIGLGVPFYILNYTLTLAETATEPPLVRPVVEPTTTPAASAAANGSSAPTTQRYLPRTAANFVVRAYLAPGDTLRPDTPMFCHVDIQNTGSGNPQFNAMVVGLPEGCAVQRVVGPVLPSKTEEQMTFEIIHPRNNALLPGRKEIAVKVTAENAYRDDVAVETLWLTVAPYFDACVEPVDF